MTWSPLVLGDPIAGSGARHNDAASEAQLDGLARRSHGRGDDLCHRFGRPVPGCKRYEVARCFPPVRTGAVCAELKELGGDLSPWSGLR